MYCFVVIDDVVVAHTHSAEHAAHISCALVIPSEKYQATVCVQEGRQIEVTAGCFHAAEGDAIAAVKAYLNTKHAPTIWGKSPLIGQVFWYQKLGYISRMYKVFRRVGGGSSPQGHGDLFECLEVEDAEDAGYEPWQYFVRRKVNLYESQLKDLNLLTPPVLSAH